MTKPMSVLLLAALLGAAPVAAQIEDPVQRKAWFYLQHLSGEAEQISRCLLYRLAEAAQKGSRFDSAPYWKNYYRKTDELGREVEAYVQQYHKKNDPEESRYSFTKRVWQVVILAGEEKAKGVNSAVCNVVLSP